MIASPIRHIDEEICTSTKERHEVENLLRPLSLRICELTKKYTQDDTYDHEIIVADCMILHVIYGTE